MKDYENRLTIKYEYEGATIETSFHFDGREPVGDMFWCWFAKTFEAMGLNKITEGLKE